jgi:outer membrane protein TolC
VNLFDGYATTAGYRRNVLQLSREKELLRNLEESIRLELATARNDMGVAAQRIEVARQAIIQSEENLRINKDRYQAQVGTATDVIDAQTLASQTRTDFHRAVFDHQVATARVLRALGQL